MPAAGARRFGMLNYQPVLVVLLILLIALAAGLAYRWTQDANKIGVTIASQPPQAKVFIDNNPYEIATSARIELPPGKYRLRLELDNHEPFDSTIEVSETRRVHKITLTKVQPAPIAAIPAPPVKADPVKPPKTAPAEPVKTEVKRPLDTKPAVPLARAMTLRTEPSGATFFVDGREHKEKSPAVVNLKPGKYKVKAVLAGYAAEEKVVAVQDSSVPQEYFVVLRPLPTHRHALLVGVRQGTRDLPTFVHAETDVERLARSLHVGGYKADKVSVLTQLRGQVRPAELPSAANIKLRLQTLAETTTSADILVVALIGHYLELPDEGGAYFCPGGADEADKSTLISFDLILQILASAPANKKLLILDCWRAAGAADAKPGRGRAWDRAAPAGVTILYACGKGQTSHEHPRRHASIFGYYLSHGLLGDAGHPEVNGLALADYCKLQVSRLVTESYRNTDQTPTLAADAASATWAVTTPRESTADYLAGCALLEKKDYASGQEAFQKAEVFLPHFVELFLARAEAHYHQEQFAAAQADCRTALELDSNNATAYANLGEILASPKIKDYPQALKNLTRAIELEPDCALSHNARGLAHAASKEHDAAIKDFSQAIRLQPRLVFPYGNRALAYMSRKRLDDARADLDKAIALDDRQAIPYSQRALYWSRIGEHRKAIDDYSAVIKLEDAKPQWWNARGKVRLLIKEYDGAIDDLKKAIALDPKYKPAWLNLSDAYVDKGLFPLAAEALVRMVTLDPANAKAHRQLSNVYRKLNDDKKAKEHQKIADKLDLK